MRILNAGDKCTQLDLNSKLIGDLFLIINVFSFSLKEQTSFRTEITVPQIHIYTLKAIIQKVILYYISKRKPISSQISILYSNRPDTFRRRNYYGRNFRNRNYRKFFSFQTNCEKPQSNKIQKENLSFSSSQP